MLSIIAFNTSYFLLFIFFVQLCLSSLEHKCHEGKGCRYLDDAASLATRTVSGTQKRLNKEQLSELSKSKAFSVQKEIKHKEHRKFS